MPEFDDFLIAQLLAGIAILFYLITFQFKERSGILACMSGSAFFNACHFLALGSYPAALLALISMSRSVTAYFTTKKALMSLFSSCV